MVDLALRMVRHDRMRFAITIAGVVFAATLVLVQTGLFLGAMDNASTMITHANADLWITARNATNIDFAQVFSKWVVDRVRETPGVAHADNLLVGYVTISLPTGVQELIEVYGMRDFARWGIPWRVPRGDVTDLRRGPYVLVDASAARRFGAFAIGDYRQFMGRRLQIIGRTKGALSFTTTPISFMDINLLRALEPRLYGGQTHYVLVRVAPGANVARVAAALRQRLPYNDVLTRDQWAAQSRKYWIKSTGLGLNMYITVMLGALVGVVVVSQTFYGATMEHRREFGTLKAIGGRNRDIYRILLEQAVIAAIIGFAIAELVPVFLRGPLSREGLKVILPPSIHIAVLAGTIVFCLAAALLSFRNVAGIDPALVFRS
ncbi:MAG: ABC transporter permease [Gemmatimonadaceae bacterium]